MRRLTTRLTELAVANFVAFWFITVAIGGDAFSGKVEGGHYYLGNHGRYTERSAAVWTYSRWHAISVFVTFPLAMIGNIIVSSRARPTNPGNATIAASRARLRDDLMP